MSALKKIFGFPDRQEQDSIRFHFAKNLSYSARITTAFGLILTGLTIQIILINIYYFGFPLVLAGTLLLLTKGYDSRIRLKTYTPDPNWAHVDIEKIRELENLRKRSVKWDSDALDFSNARGCSTFFLLIILFTGIAFIAGAMVDDHRVTTIILIDSALLIVPFWFTGMRFILKQPNLAIKVRIILSMYDTFQSLKQPGESFKPAILMVVGKDNATVPVDARFSIGFDNQPPGLYGLQAQININLVQGTSYPYFYCVIAAKPGFGLDRYKDKVPLGKKIICEYQSDTDAEVLVIRQKTTKKSGYNTPDAICATTLGNALQGARVILADR